MTFGDHLEVLRRMLCRIIAVVAVLMVVIFCFKDITFSLLLAPSKSDFITYQWLAALCDKVGIDFHFEDYSVRLIATNLSSQFMTHVAASCNLALLAASPYIVFELFRFISPALYENEKKYSVRVVLSVYMLFVVGVLMTYFVLFPISFRFLGTYQVAAEVTNNITIDSYIGTLATLTLLMGVVFQLPVLTYFLAKMGIIDSDLLCKYRRHALVLIMILAAIITPPDLMTLAIVTIPMYLLYELSILIIKH